MTEEIIFKIKKANLTGRGGAAFPTWIKWVAVKNIKNKKKYVIANGSEGEVGVHKDEFILKNYPEEVIEGIKIAMKTINASGAYLYLKKPYYKKFKNKLKKIIGQAPIYLFKKTCGYICGEETALLNSIEGKRAEPRLKPPYPFAKGLFGCPTLINNIETFFWVAKIKKSEYENKRFYSITGQVKNPGVYQLPVGSNVKQILKATDNFPDSPFFCQIGGGASGEIITSKELDHEVCGTGGLIVYHADQTDLYALMKRWSDFFYQESCGQCAPCREGVYRIREILAKRPVNWGLLKAVLFVMRETSFCPFGAALASPFESLISKICLKK